MRYGNTQGELVEITVSSDDTKPNGAFGILNRIHTAMAGNGFVNLEQTETFQPTSYWKILTLSVLFSIVSTVGMYWLFVTTLIREDRNGELYSAMPYIGCGMLVMCLVGFMLPQHQQRCDTEHRAEVRGKLAALGKI